MIRIWKILLSMIVGMLCSSIASAQSSGGGPGQSSETYSITPTLNSTYQWFVVGGTFQGASTGTSVVVDWIPNHNNYKVGVQETSVYGCKGDTVWYEVEEGRVIFPYIFGKRLVCEGERVELYASSEDTTYKDLIYKWSTGETTQDISVTVYKETTLYCVVYYNGDAVDTAFITIQVLPTPKPSFTWSPLYPKIDEEVTFTFNSAYPFDYYWIINGRIDTTKDRTFTTIFDSAGTNKVGLYMKNELGCDNIKTYSFDVATKYPFLIPEVFSPNGDGINDELVMKLPEGLKSCELRIFNRWGQIVFRSNDINDLSWDGKYGGQVATDGTYVYQIEAYALNNKYLFQNGTINVVK